MSPTYVEVELLACQMYAQAYARLVATHGAVAGWPGWDNEDAATRNWYRTRAEAVLAEAFEVVAPPEKAP